MLSFFTLDAAFIVIVMRPRHSAADVFVAFVVAVFCFFATLLAPATLPSLLAFRFFVAALVGVAAAAAVLVRKSLARHSTFFGGISGKVGTSVEVFTANRQCEEKKNLMPAHLVVKPKFMSDQTDQTVVVVPQSQMSIVIAASLGLIVSLVILYVFYRVMQSLLRLRKVTASLKGLDKAQLMAMVGDAEAAEALKEGSDSLWINLTVVGIFIVYGVGAVLGAGASVVTLYKAVSM